MRKKRKLETEKRKQQREKRRNGDYCKRKKKIRDQGKTSSGVGTHNKI